MIYKGCVLSLEKDYAIVMTDRAEYIRVMAKSGLAVGENIIFTTEDLFRDNRAVSIKALKLAAAFVILFFAAAAQLFFSNNSASRNIAAVVSLDINPSIELEINYKGEVIGVIPLNDDGEAILDEELDKRPIAEAICGLLENAELQGYLKHDENCVLISLSPLAEGLGLSLKDIEAKVVSFTNDNGRFTNIDLMFIQGSKTILEEARQNGISSGRYCLYEKLKGEQQGLTIDKVRTMELEELFYRLGRRQGYDYQIEPFSETGSDRLVIQAVYEQVQQRNRVRIMEETKALETDRINTRVQDRVRKHVQEDKENEIKNKNQIMQVEKNSSGEGPEAGYQAQGEGSNEQAQAPIPQGEPQNQEENMGVDTENAGKGNPDVEITPGDNGNNGDDKGSGGKNEDGRSNKSGKGN